MEKAKKVEEIPEHIVRFKKIYGRYQRNYNIIVCLCIAAVIAVFYYIAPFWGVASFAFGFWSWLWYEDGAQQNCMDEWEFAYPKDGFRRMLKSWPWYAVLATIAYFFCKATMPWCFQCIS